MSIVRRSIGAAGLAVATGCSAVLSLSHLGTTTPGCGPGSACTAVANSVWGSIPGLGWPTAFVGFAWFAGLFVAWLVGRGRLPIVVRGLAWGGGAISVLLTGVMIVGIPVPGPGGERAGICPWCLASHVGNFIFIAALLMPERAAAADEPADATASMRRLAGIACLAVAVCATGGLAVAKGIVGDRARLMDEAENDRTADEVIANAARRAAEFEGAADGEAGAAGVAAAVVSRAEREADERAAADRRAAADAPILDGRWTFGPDRAPIRVVVFFDYQCPDCQRVEAELLALLAERDDMNIGVRHFPFCVDCNRLARDLEFNPHPNACWAARAAEAAGILGGADAFESMHKTLFAMRGGFTGPELRTIAENEGHDPDVFVRLMQTPGTLRPVEDDVEMGIGLGLVQTPMVFVNGVELTGIRTRGAIRRTIERLGAENLPSLTAEQAGDRAPTAAGRFLDTVLARRPASADAIQRSGDASPATWGDAGEPTALPTVTLFGDLTDPANRRIDARLRGRAASDGRVRYAFRHAPLDTACHPGAPTTRPTGGCVAARLAIAAQRLGDADAARRAHEVLVTLETPVTMAAAPAVAAAAGLDPAALAAAASSPETQVILTEDGRDAIAAGAARRSPAVFIAGRPLDRFDYDGTDLLERAIDRAIEFAAEAGGGDTGATTAP